MTEVAEQTEPAVQPTDVVSELPPSPVPVPRPMSFGRLRSALGLPDDYVADSVKPEGDAYMSHAELESAKEWEDYPDCGGTLVFVDREGPLWTAECDECGLEVGVPARSLDAELQAGRLVERAGLPARFLSKPYDKDAGTSSLFVRQWLRTWVAGERLSPAPALWGKPGRGKTHLFVVACRELIVRRKVGLLFKTAPQLLSELQAAMGTTRFDVLWRSAVSAPVLALDDLGAEMDTDWRADRIAALVDERYRADLPLAVTTNVVPDMWPDLFDHRTASRLREMVLPLELLGEDRRMAAAEQMALSAES